MNMCNRDGAKKEIDNPLAEKALMSAYGFSHKEAQVVTKMDGILIKVENPPSVGIYIEVSAPSLTGTKHTREIRVTNQIISLMSRLRR